MLLLGGKIEIGRRRFLPAIFNKLSSVTCLRNYANDWLINLLLLQGCLNVSWLLKLILLTTYILRLTPLVFLLRF